MLHSEPTTQKVLPGKRFFHNVVWSWLGIFFGFAFALLLSPYVVHHLGEERYGIWALAFSLVDYYAVVDFGFRSAVLKYAAHYRATGETDRLESLVSTGLVYFSVAALLVVAASFMVAANITRLFKVLPRDASALEFLTISVGVGFALAIVFGVFTAVLEAYQRFDITSRILIVNNGVRVIGCFAVIYAGWGLKAMGVCVLAGQFVGYALSYRALRQVLPGRTFPLRQAHLSTLRQMLGYGVRTFVANVSLHVLNQNAPMLIGHFLSATFVGYYVYSSRLLRYPVELCNRLGTITGSKAAELTALGDMQTMSRMAVLVNRYSLMLFLPLAVYLTVFGRQLLQVWISPSFAVNCAPLLPVLGAGIVIATAAQFNSTSILYGMAKHGALARALAVEAVLSLVGLWYVIPRYGLRGAAWMVSGLMIASRGIYVPRLVCRHLRLGYWRYSWGIYARPTALMTPVVAAAWLVNRALGEPATWSMVLSAGAGMAACYYGAAFYWVVEPEHREVVLSSVSSWLRVFSSARHRTGDT